jgi:hypothetical protein
MTCLLLAINLVQVRSPAGITGQSASGFVAFSNFKFCKIHYWLLTLSKTEHEFLLYCLEFQFLCDLSDQYLGVLFLVLNELVQFAMIRFHIWIIAALTQMLTTEPALEMLVLIYMWIGLDIELFNKTSQTIYYVVYKNNYSKCLFHFKRNTKRQR